MDETKIYNVFTITLTINRKAAIYGSLWLLAIAAFVVALGVLSWQINSGNNGFNINYCSVLLQYCGLDARISIKEMLYLWFGWALLPTIIFIGFIYLQARNVDTGQARPSLLRFALTTLVAMIAQALIAYQLWGVRYYVNDLVRPSAQSDVNFFGFLVGFIIIAFFTVGMPVLILATTSSGIQKLHKG